MSDQSAIRDLEHHELAGAATCLAAAFETDPWFRWLYPDDATWATNASAWFGLVLERAFRFGLTFGADSGAVNWIGPEGHFPGDDDVAIAVELLGSQIGERAMTAFGVIGQCGAAFPDRPRYHCVYVGVHPQAQGHGLGRALLTGVLDRCDREGMPASLTSTNDRNLAFYRSLGFEEIASVAIPGTSSMMRPMWREPRRAA